jgi:class 3 adenylate cyclase
MKVKSATIALCRKTLYESMSAETMTRFVQLLDPEYDLYQRSGIPENIPITDQMAAERIVKDVVGEGRYVDFVETLVHIDANGYMGRPYPIKGLRELVKALTQDGYIFDRSTGQFFENAKERTSPDWGRLRDGDERQIALLRLDVVDNSSLVKRNRADRIEKAFSDLRSIVNKAVVGRLGRLWSWEGDGALAAFLFGQKERAALLAGMDILNEMFFYNRLENPLDEPLRIRLAAHAGPIRYSGTMMELLKNETVKDVNRIESTATPSDSLSASINLFLSIDRVIQDRFGPEKQADGGKIRHYSVALDKP